ncbi:hypothetical protein Glove_212g201 [Diversispora epigaea]|uniref:Peptidase S1 domain-containing protein n=1 Tax=Diversispora epigaea TaxID=1348612 RepID=A0A397IPD0_9GLOM|nr:hypothetical protein Glove_212g201 [Diversispora epigaea]
MIGQHKHYKMVPHCSTTTKNSHLRSRAIAPLCGGDGIKNLNSNIVCSLGFWCKTSSGDNVFTTAGHCLIGTEGPWYHKPWSLAGSPNYGDFIGYKINAVNQPDDFGYISIAGTNVLPTYFIQNSDDTAFPFLKIKGNTDSGVGALVCRSGISSHVACGYIVLTGQTIRDGQTGETVSNVNVISITDADAAPQQGDSGGAYFEFKSEGNDVNAVGTHIGSSCLQYPGSPACAPMNVALMQPLSHTLALYNLRLIVAPQ